MSPPLKANDLAPVIAEAIENFHGNLNDLGSAIGMLTLGQRYGWRVVMLIHSPGTVRKYLKILGLKHLRDHLPEVGDLAHRSNAWRLVDGTNQFWKVVRGQISGVRSALAEKRREPD